MAAYDIGDALSRIENILLASIARNLRRHANEEEDYQKSWNMWQTEQLATLEKWSRQNLKAHADTFRQINDTAIQILQETNSSGEYDEEIQLMLSGLQRDADFFDLPNEKFSSLLNCVRQDLSKAEYSILRQADDIYRQSIWNAQVYLQSGSGTLNQAIDMTVKDMASAGIRSVIYRNGRRVPASSYARMALRTANERAQLMGEGRARDKYGVHTIIVPKSGICCPECAKWLCKVMVDDVYSGGTTEEADRLQLPLLSEAIAQGFMHPQCNCSPQTYFEGMPVPEITEAERQKAVDNYNLTQKQRYNEAQIRKYKRLQKNVTDPVKQKEYAARVKDWQKRNQQLCDAHPDILRRDYNREKVWDEEIKPKTLDISGGSGIIEAGDSADVYHEITDESISRIPKLDIFESDDLNIRHQEAAKELLREAKKYPPAGRELLIVYDENMNPIPGHGYVIGEVGSVRADNPGVPFHALHNHGSGETLGITDLMGFIENQDMLSISAVGNTGSLFSLIKLSNSDAIGYGWFLHNKAQTTIFSANSVDYSLKKITDKKQRESMLASIASLDSSQREELRKAIKLQTEVCLKGGEQYGYKYRFETS